MSIYKHTTEKPEENLKKAELIPATETEKEETKETKDDEEHIS